MFTFRFKSYEISNVSINTHTHASTRAETSDTYDINTVHTTDTHCRKVNTLQQALFGRMQALQLPDIQQWTDTGSIPNQHVGEKRMRIGQSSWILYPW